MTEPFDEEAYARYYEMTKQDENILTFDAVPAVDLSLVYSPVLPGQFHSKPVQGQMTMGGKYLLNYGQCSDFRGHPLRNWHAEVVSERELRIMRARYLIRRGYYGTYFDVLPWPYYKKQEIVSLYFQGRLYVLPENIQRQSRIGWRLHLDAVRQSRPPDEGTVEGTIREVKALLAQEREKGGQ